MKKKMFAAYALTCTLLAAPVVQAQSLLDIFIGQRSHWEFTTGIGLHGWQERTVFTENQTDLGGSQSPLSNRRRLSFKPDYLVDFDFKNSVRLNEQWAVVVGMGIGAMQYDVTMQDFSYNFATNRHEPIELRSDKNKFNFSTRVLIGLGYRKPLNGGYSIGVKLYGGAQPSGLEKDYRIQDQSLLAFNFPAIYPRTFGGIEFGLMKDGKGNRFLLPHTSINYRYMHFFGGKPHLATHALPGVHQLVFGWGLRQNPQANKLE